MPGCFCRHGLEFGFVFLVVSNETTAGPALFPQGTPTRDAFTAAESKSTCIKKAHLDMMCKTPRSNAIDKQQDAQIHASSVLLHVECECDCSQTTPIGIAAEAQHLVATSKPP